MHPHKELIDTFVHEIKLTTSSRNKSLEVSQVPFFVRASKHAIEAKFWPTGIDVIAIITPLVPLLQNRFCVFTQPSHSISNLTLELNHLTSLSSILTFKSK